MSTDVPIPTALVCGGSHGDVPLILEAKSRGLKVVTTGNRPGDIGHAFSDGYVPADYSSAAELIRVARTIRANFIVPSCHDISAIAAAEAAASLALPGHDKPWIAELIHTKSQLREALSKLSIRTPKFAVINPGDNPNPEIHRLNLPLIVKPVDLAGGRGVTVCRNFRDIDAAIRIARQASKVQTILVEEFMPGSDHAVSVVIRNGSVIFSFADDEYFGMSRFRVHGTVYPSTLPERAQRGVVRDLERFARHFNLVDGLVHSQIKWDGQTHHLLEICRRTPGDFYPWFVEMATGSPYTAAILEGFLGNDSRTTLHGYRDEPAWSAGQVGIARLVRHVAMAEVNGQYGGTSLSLPPDLHLLSHVEWRNSGERIEDWRAFSASVVFMRSTARVATTELAESVSKSVAVAVQAKELGAQQTALGPLTT